MSKRGKWGSLTGLAKIQGCSERAIRESCKQGLIEEAYQTSGGHWRIRRPLSWRTRVFLAKRKKTKKSLPKRWSKARWPKEWPFNEEGGGKSLLSDAELAELLMLHQLYQLPFLEDLPVPAYWEEEEVDYGIIEKSDPEKVEGVRRIKAEIQRRLEKAVPFWDLHLHGWMYQLVNHCSQEKLPCPTVTQMAKLMRLSRPAFYRRYPNAEQAVAKAYEIAGGKRKEELPDLGLDSVQRANRGVKKSNFESIQKVYAPKSI